MIRIIFFTAILFASYPSHAAVVIVPAGAAAAASAAASAERRLAEQQSAKAPACHNAYVVECDAAYEETGRIKRPGRDMIRGFYNGCWIKFGTEKTSVEDYFLRMNPPQGTYDISALFDSYNHSWIITGCRDRGE